MTIPHRTARKIASRWHAGQGSALYALSSTGAIDTAYYAHDVTSEITDCIDYETNPHERFQLEELRDYVTRHKPRGPIPAWSRMPW